MAKHQKSNKKGDALEASMMAGVMAERAIPAPTVQERLRRVNAWSEGTASAAPVVVEKIVEVEKIVAAPERVLLENIQDRVTNIRVVSESRARRFAASIAVVGLIQPPAIDKHGRLLAGDHRRQALAMLREVSEWPERVGERLPGLDDEVKAKVLSAWRRFGFDGGVPVHRMDVDSEQEPDLAKSIEITENDQRQDFTKPEVKNAYEQLRAAGFRETAQGRPRAGTKPMRPELALLFGKAERTISRYLAEIRADEAGVPVSSEEPAVVEAEKKLRLVFPSSRLTVTRTGAWHLVIRGKSRKDLEDLVQGLSSQGHDATKSRIGRPV